MGELMKTTKGVPLLTIVILKGKHKGYLLVIVLLTFAQIVAINTAHKASISLGLPRGKVVKVNKARGLR